MLNRWNAALLVAILWGSWVWGVNTKFWSSATFDDFARGVFHGVSLSQEGAMTVAPALEEVFNTDQAMVWAVARDRHGNLYLGTGHSGKVFRLGPDWKGALFYDAPEPDVFGLAVDKEGNVFVGTSPEGKIYKVDPSGKVQEFFDPQARYIWAMALAPDGTLYVGTGDRGKIYRVRPNGEGELFYDTQQSHVMSLALTAGSDLVVGTEPNGLLYRVSPAGKGFVLYDAPQAEIHSIAVAPDGSIYASALGAPDGRQMRGLPRQSPTEQTPLQATTTITVRASDDPSLPPGDSGEGGGQPDQARPGAGTPPQAGMGTLPLLGTRIADREGIRSTVFRVGPDNTVETLWNSPRENIFDLLPTGRNLLFSTDERGRIYELTPERQISLVTQTDQEETTRLIPLDDFVLVTTANLGKVFRLGKQPAATGSYESEVRDTGGISTWGKISWTAEWPPGTTVELYTRTGNSRRPDATWSDWSPPHRDAAGEPIQSPTAQYVQWKAVLHAAQDRSPVLREVTVAYLPRNRAPVMTEVKVTPRGERAPAGTSSGGLSVAPLGTGSATSRVFPGATLASRPALPRGIDMSWLANDPDEDELAYALYFRGEGETEWKLLEENLKQNYFQLENSALPDGKYRVKVVASDAGVNPAEMAKTAEVISAPFLVDSTPPQVEVQQTKREKDSASARFRAWDQTSVLTRAEYALDAEPLQPVLSDDGIIDSREETFTVTVPKADPREHLLTLRVYDSAGNVGVGKTVWPAAGVRTER